MTIPYKHHICTASPLNFLRIAFRWKGSVWKAVLTELVIWTLFYQIVALWYYYLMAEKQQKFFKKVVVNMNQRMNYVPLEFILGFFVNAVVVRWTDSVHNMGYVEDQAIYVANCIEGAGERPRMIRRTVVRYVCLSQVLVLRDICATVRKRFPTYESIMKAGYLLPEEKNKLESYKQLDKFTVGEDEGKYWVPLKWAFELILQAKREGQIRADIWCVKLIEEIRRFQESMQKLCNYDWVKVPLAYPQFVFLAVHIYFTICLFGRQFVVVDAKNKLTGTPHVHLPIITMMQYVFYLGWMKVAASLMDPFGEDDDDFETNFLIDKNLATSLCIVDEACNDPPELRKDQFWCREVTPLYSLDSVKTPNNPLIGSAVRKSDPRSPKMQPRMTIVRRSTRANQSPTITPVDDVRL